MRYLRWFLLVFVLFVCPLVYAYDTETPKVDILQIYTDGGRTWTNEVVSPWNTYDFSVKYKNHSHFPIIMRVSFVDGTIAVWDTPKPACKNAWDGNLFGNYVEWDTLIRLEADSEFVWSYTLSIPLEISSWVEYDYSWDLIWCITYSATGVGPEVVVNGWNPSAWWTVLDPSQSDVFAISVRRAYFMNMKVSWIEKIPPEIDSIFIWNVDIINGGNLSNIPTSSNIVIKFSEPIDTNNLSLSGILNHSFSYSWDASWMNLTIVPINGFLNNTTYHLVIDTRFKDLAGNKLQTTKDIYFTTVKANEQWGWNWWWGGGWWWGWWWWGGWGWWDIKLSEDNCPNWDHSPSLYDWSCGEYSEVEELVHEAAKFYQCSIADSDYSQEMNQAYIYACNRRITTMNTIQNADMDWPLLRKHLAKMISEFAVKEIWLKPVEDRVCNFQDAHWETAEMIYYMQLACKLWLMGMESNWVDVKKTFDPNSHVTRAEFGTVLSRLLWWTTYATNDGTYYYTKHLQALKNNGIMTMIHDPWPKNVELRWYVMLMLMRVNENNLVMTYRSHWSAADAYQNWLNWLLPDAKINMNIASGVLETSEDFVSLQWTISNDLDVASIYVTHSDSKGNGRYTEYKLWKFNPWDKNFAFYAYRYYDSLTINDVNKYTFKFYDKNNQLLATQTVKIDHNYVQ